MVCAHTGALAFMALSIPTGWSTFFLSPVRLYNIKPAKPTQRPAYKVIEPGLWELPMFFGNNPLWVDTPVVF